MELFEVVIGILIGFVVALTHYVWKARSRVVKPKVHLHPVPRSFTAEELSEYDGEKQQTIYVSVKGVVFSVAKEWYGPGEAYHEFAGQEASRQLAKTVVSTKECNADWLSLDKDHLTVLDEWFARFKGKYEIVGWFVPDAEYTQRGKQFEP